MSLLLWRGLFFIAMKDIIDATPLWWRYLLLFNVILVVVSFLLPPLGVIDGSVLTAVGELSGFALLGMIPHYLKSGKNVTVAKGNTSINISDTPQFPNTTETEEPLDP